MLKLLKDLLLKIISICLIPVMFLWHYILFERYYNEHLQKYQKDIELEKKNIVNNDKGYIIMCKDIPHEELYVRLFMEYTTVVKSIDLLNKSKAAANILAFQEGMCIYNRTNVINKQMLILNSIFDVKLTPINK